jgi:hypothetical protein
MAGDNAHLSAVLIRENGFKDCVVITDISDGGVGFEVADPPAIGEHVIVRCPLRGDLAVQIRWASALRAGGAFPMRASELPLEVENPRHGTP